MNISSSDIPAKAQSGGRYSLGPSETSCVHMVVFLNRIYPFEKKVEYEAYMTMQPGAKRPEDIVIDPESLIESGH